MHRVSIRIKSRLIVGDLFRWPHDRYHKFQSESNLGLLWGKWGCNADCCIHSGFNPNQISAYCGGSRSADHLRGLILVSIRIKSRLIVGAFRSTLRWAIGYRFQSESNLGLLWGTAGLTFTKPDSCFNPNQISAYCGGIDITGDGLFSITFQSESNLGLLWGLIKTPMESYFY